MCLGAEYFCQNNCGGVGGCEGCEEAFIMNYESDWLSLRRVVITSGLREIISFPDL